MSGWPEELLNARVVFWVCPDGHSDRRGVVTVEWRDGIAHCTQPGCDRTSISGVAGNPEGSTE